MTSSNSIKVSIFTYGAWEGRYQKHFTNFHCCHALALRETLDYLSNSVGIQPFGAVLEVSQCFIFCGQKRSFELGESLMVPFQPFPMGEDLKDKRRLILLFFGTKSCGPLWTLLLLLFPLFLQLPRAGAPPTHLH